MTSLRSGLASDTRTTTRRPFLRRAFAATAAIALAAAGLTIAAASPAAAWRIPLTEGIAPADAFKHTYAEWLYVNPWIESFAVWANAEPLYDNYISDEDPITVS
jgi:hypothetical protein